MDRNCIGCGQVDDHPRHVIDVGGVDTCWHHDCHYRATGCPVCQAVSEAGLTGDELRAHIVENDPGAAAVEQQLDPSEVAEVPGSAVTPEG